MNLKGASTIGVILIIVLSIVAIGIFLSVTLRSIRNVTAQEKAKCLGIDLEVIQCIVFPAGSPLPNSAYQIPDNGIYAVTDRGFGGGEIRDLRYHVTYNNGETEILTPVNISGRGYRVETGYKYFLEHSSTHSALIPVVYDSPTQVPVTLGVSAVVGKKDTLCELTAPALPCVVYVPIP